MAIEFKEFRVREDFRALVELALNIRRAPVIIQKERFSEPQLSYYAGLCRLLQYAPRHLHSANINQYLLRQTVREHSSFFIYLLLLTIARPVEVFPN